MHPNSMMFIHGIDNNILNYGASFLRVYQEEYKMKELYQDIIILVWNQTKKNEKRWCNFLRQYIFLNSPLSF